MNTKDNIRWKSEVLDEIFVAIASNQQLEDALVFKGARVLSIRMGGGRQSLDLDSNLTSAFVQNHPDREAQRTILEKELTHAIRRHFDRMEPVQFKLIRLTVRTNPPRSHPMGWDAFNVRLNVNDLTMSNPSLPALEIDVASPEQLLSTSVSTILIGGHPVAAYTLERIAGEKLRAFLSSLPAYGVKVKKPGEAVRVKDLYDISRIQGIHGIRDFEFWRLVGQEFRIACQSRYIDCYGLPTFQEQREVTRKTYEQATIPKDIPFDQAEATLNGIVHFLGSEGLLPFEYPLP